MGKRYDDERDNRQEKKELFEKNADEYLCEYGFKIEVNPREKIRSFDRFIVGLDGKNIAGLEYKGKGCYPPRLLLDDNVFNNLNRHAYAQKIPREKLFIGYYHGYDPKKEWTIFRVSDLIANGLGKPLYDTEYKARGVIPYNLESRRHLAISLDQLYEECYPSPVDDAQPTSLVEFLRGASDV